MCVGNECTAVSCLHPQTCRQDGTGMIGDALGDAYEHAAEQISFVANTVIDTVEGVAKCFRC